MKSIILFDTSSGSQNMGDYIINESVEKEMHFLFKDNFVVKYATHTPIAHCYQLFRHNPIYKYCKEADLKFLAGTNILQYRMLRPWANWNINLLNAKPYKGVVLIGAGVNPNRKKPDFYTKHLYCNILNKELIHSARDEKTKKFLESLGLKAINTGCATLWSLTKEHCKNIPTKKSLDVIFTLTDYCQDHKNDQTLIDTLMQNYRNVYFWVQGSEDYEYLKTFKNTNNIKIIGPSISEYRKVLQNKNVDYVGTRLHAGIYAMQNLKRSIIISIDNRTRDMKKTYNLNTIERKNISELEKLINSHFVTNININADKIKQWKRQFEG